MNDPFAHPASTNIPPNTAPHSAERSQFTNNTANNNNATPASSKWIRDDTAGREVDQVGLVAHNRGYKHILFINTKKNTIN